ncbi:UDP-N-acetylmuramoyl-L-alanyl-D-glutamate--2,6-diaminopimelate ligase [Alicyclobacillus sp. ALC3]|uniref:UDP-N-acetylmuramoyl-L-alanyl-D-glutamate--2, 6-diaminopimelate ligase n=1 Tax=Alicyclobacillus sp. ALC3 TaxID=2796143 RepID=UPI0023788948|nr:UDP-N-acetylmuramoyl-L-alanyl-D-glutamate--2,6-diaminopimelate ligase [Alicyclobacillus sp. ALC3]WDL97450.1 UDP-N-acetylmuramoyl-L-alanyl-D-glutamate--2,6-diaminopimelate ligase [Alicyclobacillus sp. ALC3]
MRLSELASAYVKAHVIGDAVIEFLDITTDSRRVQPGSLFIALRGYTVDGHAYVQDAVRAGAVAVMVEMPFDSLNCAQLVVPDTRLASAVAAAWFYNHPSERLSVIGVTGTNGKTTTTHLIERVLRDAGHQTGLLGTIGKRIGDVTVDVANTTPEAVELQSVLAEMVAADCQYAVMEVSSHALEERRVAGTRFRTAVFTNLTQDHLDFHGTMDNYRAAKGKLFSRLGNTYAADPRLMERAVLNADDAATAYLLAQSVHESITYGIEQSADVRASAVNVQAGGVSFHVALFTGEEADVTLQLTGRFNVYNALAAIAVGAIEGLPLARMVASLESVAGIPGRLERVVAGQSFTVLVDYSHTPDSLENALQTVREFATGRVLCVVGCGGDRDRGKRPLMAEVAARYSDLTLLTSDNPRTEDPVRILDDMEAGVKGKSLRPGGRYQRITDRREAIEKAVAEAKGDDVILIAGKGHETYQIIGRVKHHFDDREVAAQALVSLREDGHSAG